jgi:hypothetical protein
MIKFFYGLTLEEYDWLLNEQGSVCALCKRVPVKSRFSVDHKHEQHEHVGTKRACKECIRGLLCSNCNRSILPVLEKLDYLQTEFVKAYLNGRPFMEGGGRWCPTSLEN